MLSLQSRGLNISVRKEENTCVLHRSQKFMKEDFLLINRNHILQVINLTAPSNSI